MLSNTVLATAVLITMAAAAPLPLNINLGAYSPALVVGDGAMSFEEANAVTNLVNTLQGAAVAGAAAANTGAAAAPAAAAPAAAEGAVTTNAAASSGILTESASLPVAGQGMGKKVVRDEEPKVAKRQSAGFDRALQFAEAALTKGPKVQLGTGAEGAGVGIIVDNSGTAAAAAPKAE